MACNKLKDGRWYVAGRKGFWPSEPDRTRQYFGRGIAAEQAARRRDAELGGARARPLADHGPAFAELAVEYIKAKSFAAKSHKELTIRLERIILPAIGAKRAIDITHDDLDLFVALRRGQIANRKKTLIKDSTIRREITDIKSILNWSVKRRPPLIPFNPVAGYQAPESDDDIIIPPTPDEAAAIYAAASEHLKRAIILSWYLGLRPGAVELLTLTWASVSLQTGIIRIRSAHKGGPRHRDVPIATDLQAHIERWQKQDRARWKISDIDRRPIIHYHGGPIGKIQKSWEGALARAGIKRRIRPYDIRHSFATRALEAGADIGAVSHMMGSAPETIRRHYQHVTREMTRRVVELIPELDCRTGCIKKDDGNEPE